MMGYKARSCDRPGFKHENYFELLLHPAALMDNSQPMVPVPAPALAMASQPGSDRTDNWQQVVGNVYMYVYIHSYMCIYMCIIHGSLNLYIYIYIYNYI